MNWVNIIKEKIPDYAKDAKLNLDAVINRGKLDKKVAEGCVLAAAVSTGNNGLVKIIKDNMEYNEIMDGALGAATIMAQNNTWYPFIEMTGDDSIKGLPAQLRMNIIASSGGTTKENFEAFSLAASIIGQCHFCVKAHYDTLKKEGYSLDQLMDIGRIAAIINSIAKIDFDS